MEYDITRVLAQEAVNFGACDDALELTRALVDCDPHEEHARELRFAALVRCGDPRSVRVELETYERSINDSPTA